jgi:ATP-dependent Lon protease
MKDYALGLIGPPGVGKSSIALALSKILDFPFEQVSCACMSSTDSLHGHNYTYLGSEPGEIVRAMMRMEYMNGILFLDEFDKIPIKNSLNSLLHILDPIQNHQFKDNYIGDVPVDISSMWFILSMNELPENQALRDRIFVVDIPGYSFNEKIEIIENHTLPNLLASLNLNITISSNVIGALIRKVKDIKGMRQHIQMLKDVLYKIKFLQQNPDIEVSFKINVNEQLTLKMIEKLITTNNENEYLSFYT